MEGAVGRETRGPDGGDGRPAAPPGSDLARLLAKEAELERSLAEARRRAERRVRSAREQADAIRRERCSSTGEELASMRRRVRAEHREAVEENRAAAERRARRYRQTADEAIERLARAVVRRMVEEGP